MTIQDSKPIYSHIAASVVISNMRLWHIQYLARSFRAKSEWFPDAKTQATTESGKTVMVNNTGLPEGPVKQTE
jgi:hypothetical protein